MRQSKVVEGFSDVMETGQHSGQRSHRCDVCGSQSFERLAVEGGFSLNQCRQCFLVVCLPIPSRDQRLGIYADPEYFSGRRILTRDHIAALSEKGLAESARSLRQIKRLSPPPARMLEVGCATGAVLKAAELLGYDVRGVDLSPYAAEIARRELGLSVYNGELRGAPFRAQSFDIIACYHLVEHLSGPSEFLSRCRDLLRPGGILVVEVPDFGSLFARRQLTRWLHFKPMEHIHHFDERSLSAILTKCGFEMLRVERDGWASVFDFCGSFRETAPVRNGGHDSRSDRGVLLRTARSVKACLCQVPGIADALEDMIFRVVALNDFLRAYARRV